MVKRVGSSIAATPLVCGLLLWGSLIVGWVVLRMGQPKRSANLEPGWWEGHHVMVSRIGEVLGWSGLVAFFVRDFAMVTHRFFF